MNKHSLLFEVNFIFLLYSYFVNEKLNFTGYMNITPPTKQTIIQLIKNNDSSLAFVKPKTSSSRVWLNFSYVYINNKKQDFVSCDTCKDVLYHTSTDGTSSMIKHHKSCQTSNNTTNRNQSLGIKEYFRPKKSQTIPRKIKEKITNAAVEFVSLDTRAFKLISGNGFTYFAQTLFDAGQKLSNIQHVNIEDLLPHPTTVSNKKKNRESKT
jgi:hypothetical protein